MFTEDQEQKLKLVADHFDDFLLAVNIAKDELMRINVNKHFHADANDMDSDKRERCVMARSIMRKMYQHHADLKEYPFTIKELNVGLTAEQLKDYFEKIEDINPDSESFRTLGT